VIRVSGRFNAADKSYTLECRQEVPATPGQPVKEPMIIPLRFGLVGKNGRDLPFEACVGGKMDHDVLVLDKRETTFAFSGVTERPVLSINRGFSAPIRLDVDVDADDLAYLASSDSDPFNRWQALQTISMRMLIANVSATREGGATRIDDKLIVALAAVLEDASLEPAFVALALVPPGEGDIAREIGLDIDPDAIFGARAALRAEIGKRLNPALSTIYQRMTMAGGYSPDATSAGRRALRNAVLDLLAAEGSASGIARAAQQYDAADNMTDRMAALATLSLHDTVERQRSLSDFYQRYASDALVVDKWFSLQAMIPEAGTLENVRRLGSHPAFSMANPNRVRALIGAFAQSNATQFNRADGAGYNFVADAVLALDPKNPQVAARLTTAFRTWRTLEPNRRAKAEGALRRIRAAANLSRDVTDIVDRALSAP